MWSCIVRIVSSHDGVQVHVYIYIANFSESRDNIRCQASSQTKTELYSFVDILVFSHNDVDLVSLKKKISF